MITKFFKKRLGNIFFVTSAIFLVVIVFFPAVFVLSYFTGGKDIFTWEIIDAVLASFGIGLAVVLVNFVFGLPLAWLVVRGKSKLVKYLDSLIDLSLVIPTAALGFSIYL